MAYNRIPQTPTDKYGYDDEDILEIPSPFDTALNGGTNGILLPKANPEKEIDGSVPDPGAFRRLSVSTVSSRGRSVSPSLLYPAPPSLSSPAPRERTWRGAIHAFWGMNQGLFLVALSQLFGALMNVTARLLELEGDGMDPFQILFARQGLTALLCTAWMWWTQVPGFPLGNKGVRALLCLRAFAGFFGIFGMYYSLQYLPIADATILTFLAPSVASYGCYIFLREPFPRSAQYASLISLLGVVLIARPTSFFSSSPANLDPISSISLNGTSSPPHDFPTPTNAQRLSAVGVAMLGVLGSAGAFTSIRWIGNRAHPLLSVNYFSIYCFVISLLALTLPIPSSPSFKLPETARQWAMLLFLGTCGFVMQFLLTKGLAAGGRGEGARATNMIYTNMLFAMGLDRVVFGVTPGWWSLGGSGLILGSAIYVGMVKNRAAAEEEEGRDVEAAGVREEELGMLIVGGRPEIGMGAEGGVGLGGGRGREAG